MESTTTKGEEQTLAGTPIEVAGRSERKDVLEAEEKYIQERVKKIEWKSVVARHLAHAAVLAVQRRYRRPSRYRTLKMAVSSATEDVIDRRPAPYPSRIRKRTLAILDGIGVDEDDISPILGYFSEIENVETDHKRGPVP